MLTETFLVNIGPTSENGVQPSDFVFEIITGASTSHVLMPLPRTIFGLGSHSGESIHRYARYSITETGLFAPSKSH